MRVGETLFVGDYRRPAQKEGLVFGLHLQREFLFRIFIVLYVVVEGIPNPKAVH